MKRKKKRSRIPLVRKRQHLKYVEASTIEQRGKVIKAALLYGKVKEIDRILFLKYNDYLNKLES
tara:strand:+ start:253 stop:444 length:192 start_codon:yes stop_codon:yes gene_type:complete